MTVVVDHFSPTAIVNRSLNMCGMKTTIGNIEEGTDEAKICLRTYGESLRKLLRAAPWDFARKSAPLLLLADTTGQTTTVSSYISTPGWLYAYAYPTDMARLRYIPWNPFLNPGAPAANITPTNGTLPISTSLTQLPYGGRVVPSRFLVTSSQDYLPPDIGDNPNASYGIAPTGRTVILSNVPSAVCIYTYDALYPNLWDYLFRDAIEALIAAEIAFALYDDKVMGMKVRDGLYPIVKDKVRDARAASANENWSSSDIGVDWMRARVSGWAGGMYGTSAWGAGGDYGCWGGGWEGSLSLGNGSAF